MRIALVTRELSPFFGAGIGAYASAMARAWAAAGLEIHLLTGAHPGLTEGAPRELPGVRVHPLDPASGLAGRMPFAFQRHSMAALELLERMHAQSPLDVIEFPEYWAEGYFAVCARRASGRLAGAALVVRLHTPTRECRDLNREERLDEELATLEWMEEETIRHADAVLSPSRSLLEILTARLGLIDPRQRRIVVPYPFDAAALQRITPIAASVPTLPTVLYFGRLERRKGVDLLVLAAQRLLRSGVKARFVFIGGDTQSGPDGASMLPHLRGLIEPRFESAFTFEPPRARERLPAAILEAIGSGGLCCFPSRWENFPNACLEAMSLGAPIVASDAGGMAEIIEDRRSGLLFRAGDEESLSTAIGECLRDRALRARLASAAPARIAELCAPMRVVEGTINAVRGASRVEPPAPAGDVLWRIPPGASLLPGADDAVRDALSRNPGADGVLFLSESAAGVHAPCMDRDTLSATDCGPLGGIAIAHGALARPGLSDAAVECSEDLWALAARLARAKATLVCIPQVLAVGAPRLSPHVRNAAAFALAHACPDLPADPGRASRIQQGLFPHADLLIENNRTLRAELQHARARLHQLESQLDSTRYRIADRVNDAAKSLGIQPVLRAAIGKGKSERGDGAERGPP